MFRRKGILKKKHYLLILFTIFVLAFFQQFVLFLGNLMIIVGLGAYIYTDMTPEAQDELEKKVSQGMKNARDYLRRSPSEREELPMAPAKQGRFNKLLSRSKPVNPQTDQQEEDTPPIVDAEIIREHEPERDARQS